jgi:TonB family protein
MTHKKACFALLLLALLVTSANVRAQQGNDRGGAPAKEKAGTAGNLEVLSDTKGVDFGPYLNEMLKKVRVNWYNLIPEEARPPQLASGVTSIEFRIMPDGNIAGVRIVQPSGSVPLDRAAWGGIMNGNPYPPLPQKFTGPFLALRFHFYYNPEKLPPDQRPAVKTAPPGTQKSGPN